MVMVMVSGAKLNLLMKNFFFFCHCVLGGKILEVLRSEIGKEWAMGLDEKLEFMKRSEE